MKLGARAWIRGHKIRYDEDAHEWVYGDTLISTKRSVHRPCAKCGKFPTEEGHDACLGYIPGATYACCGHGVKSKYIMYSNGDEYREIDRKALDEFRTDRQKYHTKTQGPTGCGETFSELLCHDLHTKDGEIYGGYDFRELASRFGISLESLGEIILDHCYGLAGISAKKLIVFSHQDTILELAERGYIVSVDLAKEEKP